MKRKKLGLIVNPIAGIGGRVGLKGSDGPEILKRALELGAVPESPRRAVEALRRLEPARESIEVVTYPDEMGESEARECGFAPTVIGRVRARETTAEDTESAAREMMRFGVALIVFAGGDGTARNIYNAVGDRWPALGIPAGVKIHSAVYATSPANAGELALKYLRQAGSIPLRDAEVMDIDERAFRENRVSAELYGYLKVPYERNRVQSAKAGSATGDAVAMDEIACDVINKMEDDTLYVIGPGTTTQAIMEKLEFQGTLLGVDVIQGKRSIGSDVNESQLLKFAEDRRARIIVTIIGGQGYIFGRGNQQISARVIKKVGKENIMVVATENKLLTLFGKDLLVDTGDPEIDDMLSGYVRVTTGLHRSIVCKVTR